MTASKKNRKPRKLLTVVSSTGEVTKHPLPKTYEETTVKGTNGLTFKQEMFASETATEMLKKPRGAAHRASIKVYKNAGSAHLAKEHEEVKAAIQEKIDKQLEMHEITRDRIALELGRIAFADMGKMFDGENLKSFDEMDEDTRRAIMGFDVERRTERHGDKTEVYYVLKPRMYNKNQALDILTRLKELPGDKANGQQGSMAAMPTFKVNFVSATANINAPKS